MDVDRTNSLNHRKEFTVNYPSFCFATHGTSRRGELKFCQELCTDCYAIEARFAVSVDHMAEAFISIHILRIT